MHSKHCSTTLQGHRLPKWLYIVFFCFGTLPAHQHGLPPQGPVSKQLRNANLTERSHQSKTRVNRRALHYARKSSCWKCLTDTHEQRERNGTGEIFEADKSLFSISAALTSVQSGCRRRPRVLPLLLHWLALILPSPESGLKVSRKEPVNKERKRFTSSKQVSSPSCRPEHRAHSAPRKLTPEARARVSSLRHLRGEHLGCSFLFTIHYWCWQTAAVVKPLFVPVGSFIPYWTIL